MTIQHSAIPDAQLHEPKGVASAGLAKVYVANGTGSGTWDYPLPEGAATALAGKQLTSNGAGDVTWSFQPQALTLDIDSMDTVTDYYLVVPYAGTISKIYSVIDTAIATADKILTASIGGVAITNGALTVAFTGSAAGDVDSCTPSALNTVTAGQAVKIAASGGSTGAARAHITLVYTRTA